MCNGLYETHDVVFHDKRVDWGNVDMTKFYNFDDIDHANLWGYVSENAVSTVMKCLGVRQYQYEEYQHIYQHNHTIWFMDEYNKILKNCIKPYFETLFKYKKLHNRDKTQDIWSSVSNMAVQTVLKFLGTPQPQYDNFRLMYRKFKWVGMGWSMNQYNGLLKDEVRPYFKEKYNE